MSCPPQVAYRWNTPEEDAAFAGAFIKAVADANTVEPPAPDETAAPVTAPAAQVEEEPAPKKGKGRK